ncbi:MAG: helix-turn-helix transcriptional regulator [Chitinophagaceae bacterium]
MKAFGANLRLKRKELGFSQEGLAYGAGIELRQIGRIERGEINTGIASIKIIADTLGIKPQLLFDFE